MKERQAVRGLLMDRRAGEVLLIRGRVPDTGLEIWITPGGGLDPGESLEQGLVREVFEETGLRPTRWQGPVWIRRVQFVYDGVHYDQTETFYAVWVDRFEPNMDDNPVEHERDNFVEFRWWRPEEVAQSDDAFAPANLGALLPSLFAGELPRTPLLVSV